MIPMPFKFKACLLPLCLSLAFLSFMGYSQAGRIDIGRFSSGSLDNWEEKSFAGKTNYSLASDGHQTALRAESQGSASGLYRKITMNLKKNPYLNWSWKVENLISGQDERRKAGDDYPARIYVVFSEGLMFWRTKAINYVWSSSQPEGSEWPNAFTANARMIALQSGDKALGEWVHEKRDVLADYRRLFGKEPGKVSAVALMTDTDNTGLTATAWYGDIWFSAQ